MIALHPMIAWLRDLCSPQWSFINPGFRHEPEDDDAVIVVEEIPLLEPVRSRVIRPLSVEDMDRYAHLICDAENLQQQIDGLEARKRRIDDEIMAIQERRVA